MTILERELKSWDDIHGHVMSGWIYRGQRAASYDLKSSFERWCDRQVIDRTKRHGFEARLFREFRRVYHQYGLHVPQSGWRLEWFSLMQHHGAPTRLLDFTYSIYVAAYFAVEGAAPDDCAIWGVNGPWALSKSIDAMRNAGKSAVDTLPEFFEEKHERIVGKLFFDEPQTAVACPLNPFRLNERLRAQKGVFLVPGDVSKPFMENLASMPGYDTEERVTKILIPSKLRLDALRHLHHMNISRTTLFPGLDGYAQSLGIYHPLLDPIPWRSRSA